MWALSTPLSELLLLKVTQYAFGRVPELQLYLRSTHVLSELELFRLSVAEEEPPKEDRPRTLQRLKSVAAFVVSLTGLQAARGARRGVVAGQFMCFD